MANKPQRELTPVGEAKWAHLQTPKVAFTDERGHTKGDPKYQVDVYFAKDDPAWSTWATKVMAKMRGLPDQIDKRSGESMKKQTPIKRELDEAEQQTGRFYVTFKTSDRFKPGVFDKYGAVLPENVLIGNGSKVRVSYLENVYEAFGGGINFYLNAVQVLELVEFQSQTAESYGFDVVSAAPVGSGFEAPAFVDGDDSIPF